MNYYAKLKTNEGTKEIEFDASDDRDAMRVALLSAEQLYGGGYVLRCVPSYLI